jgi:hypothetical protein
MQLTLALVGYVLLLVSTLCSMVVSWRTLKDNTSLHRKIDWLRQTLVTRDSTIRSYETGSFSSSEDDNRTRVVPPPLPRRGS